MKEYGTIEYKSFLHKYISETTYSIIFSTLCHWIYFNSESLSRTDTTDKFFKTRESMYKNKSLSEALKYAEVSVLDALDSNALYALLAYKVRRKKIDPDDYGIKEEIDKTIKEVILSSLDSVEKWLKDGIYPENHSKEEYNMFMNAFTECIKDIKDEFEIMSYTTEADYYDNLDDYNFIFSNS